jgi:hypothetical protein
MKNRSVVLDRIGYSWWMLRATTRILSHIGREHTEDPVRRALVESLAMNDRVLVEFFSNHEKHEKDGTECGLRVRDLDLPEATTQKLEQWPPIFRTWWDRASAYAVHADWPEEKVLWDDALVLEAELDKRMKTLREVFNSDVPEQWRNRPFGTALIVQETLERSKVRRKEKQDASPAGMLIVGSTLGPHTIGGTAGKMTIVPHPVTKK